MCSCQVLPDPAADRLHGPGVRRSSKRPATALVLGFLVAFFPKCPVCWAAYMTTLGVAGSFQIPYPGYLYPLLAALLALHLWSLVRRSALAGRGPSLVSLGGALTLLVGHRWLPSQYWLLVLGILLVFGGSLWNSFAMKQPPRRRCLPVMAPDAGSCPIH